MCNLGFNCTLYEFEDVYDLKYLNIDPEDENRWEIFANKTRDIMAKCLEIPKIEEGIKEKK